MHHDQMPRHSLNHHLIAVEVLNIPVILRAVLSGTKVRNRVTHWGSGGGKVAKSDSRDSDYTYTQYWRTLSEIGRLGHPPGARPGRALGTARRSNMEQRHRDWVRCKQAMAGNGVPVLGTWNVTLKP